MLIFVKKTTKLFVVHNNNADSRNKVMVETLSGIKRIKFKAWENVVSDKMIDLRLEDCGYIGSLAKFLAIIASLPKVTTY